ncbi:MAG: AbrB/MazE/SpoVT family DNA-binding domain-containing protein [Chloroflexota bacterium]
MATTFRATVDSEGRIVLPEDVRRRLGLEPGIGVDIVEAGDSLVIGRPLRNGAGDVVAPDAGPILPMVSDIERVMRSRSMFPSPRPMSPDLDDEIEEAIADAMAGKYPWTVRKPR